MARSSASLEVLVPKGKRFPSGDTKMFVKLEVEVVIWSFGESHASQSTGKDLIAAAQRRCINNTVNFIAQY